MQKRRCELYIQILAQYNPVVSHVYVVGEGSARISIELVRQ